MCDSLSSSCFAFPFLGRSAVGHTHTCSPVGYRQIAQSLDAKRLFWLGGHLLRVCGVLGFRHMSLIRTEMK